MNSKIKYFFFIGVIIIASYIAISTYIGLTEMKPHFNRIFGRAENLEQNQILTDSIFPYETIEGVAKEINFYNGKYTIHFVKNSTLTKGKIKKLNKILKQNLDENHLIMSVENRESLRKFTAAESLKINLFRCDTTQIPLKYNEFIFPYTISVDNGILKQSYLGL